MAWDSKQYIKFKTERTQPSVDLISRIDTDPKTILDIGCGPGNSTQRLYERFPQAQITGIDNSENMLNTARQTYPHLQFSSCDVPDGLDAFPRYDLIFSNACLHWIPDHEKLLPALLDKLSPDGVLAVQMPLVQYAPFYHILHELTKHKPWDMLQDIHNFHNLLPDETYEILAKEHAEITMWETTYYHVLPSHDGIIEWYKGSGLRPYLERLNDAQQAEFTAQLKQKLADVIPVHADGTVILKMPRLFFLAKRK